MATFCSHFLPPARALCQGTVLVGIGLDLKKNQFYRYSKVRNLKYLKHAVRIYRTQTLILDFRSIRIIRYMLLLRHAWQLRFQLPDLSCTHNLLIICILLLFGHSHTSPPRILKQHENSGSWHCSCQEISFLQQQISIASISDHQPMTLQIWSWRNSKDIAVPDCDAAAGVL